MITAAADGSALGNPGHAGWAWYVDDDCWAAGGWMHATNNQGELTAVLELFRATAHVDDELLVLCDSLYVINSVTKWMPGWKRKGWRKSDGKPVMNVELLKELDDAITGRRYRFEWVRGHVGHPLNEAADARARAAAEAYRGGYSVPVGPGFGGRGSVMGAAVLPASAAVAEAVEEVAIVEEAVVEEAVIEETVAEEAVEDPALFSLEDLPAEWLTLTVQLTAEEHRRLVERARNAGLTTEELLRGLI